LLGFEQLVLFFGQVRADRTVWQGSFFDLRA